LVFRVWGTTGRLAYRGSGRYRAITSIMNVVTGVGCLRKSQLYWNHQKRRAA
jgi:hypothetical protein